MRLTLLIVLVLCIPSLAADLPRPQKQPTGHLYPFQKDGQWGFIDSTGAIVYDAMFAGAEPRFSNGYVVLKVGDQVLWLSEGGKFVVPQQHIDAATGSAEGLFKVNVGRQIRLGDILANPGRWGFMDTSGKMAIPATLTDVAHFSDGLAAAGVRGPGERRARWGYIGKDGKWVIEPKYLSARSFSGGCAFVGVALPGERFVKQGVIDGTGKMVIRPQFLQAQAFRNGLAAVKKDEAWGYIDRRGNTVVPFEYQAAETFNNGRGLVWKWKKKKLPSLLWRRTRKTLRWRRTRRMMRRKRTRSKL